MKSLAVVICLVCFSSACVVKKSFAPHQKITAYKAKSDIQLLKNILKANHPSLYWYTSKEQLDKSFDSAINSLRDSVTERELRNTIASVISQIRCGHTSVRFSKAYATYLSKEKAPHFPLSVKTWDDSLVVLSSLRKNDSIFKRGTIITSINGKSRKAVLDTMFKFINTDGYTNNFKSQIVSFNFPAYYRNGFGMLKEFQIEFLDSFGKQTAALVPAYEEPKDSIKKSIDQPIIKTTRKEKKIAQLIRKRNLQIDTVNNIAYMQLNTFSDGSLSSFFRKTFKQLHKEQIKNLIIDLRQNGGGNIGNCTKLSKYLADHPFNIADTVAAISRKIKYSKYIKPAWLYWLSLQFFTHKQLDGKYHMGVLERQHHNPKKKNHYNGNIYLIQGGYTFSAATMLISNLKGQKNVTVVGEETGGGYYGNSAIHLPIIILPASKIRVSLPLFRVVFHRNREKTGRGFFPDIEVKPSAVSIQQGIDLKMKTIQEMIKKRDSER